MKIISKLANGFTVEAGCSVQSIFTFAQLLTLHCYKIVAAKHCMGKNNSLAMMWNKQSLLYSVSVWQWHLFYFIFISPLAFPSEICFPLATFMAGLVCWAFDNGNFSGVVFAGGFRFLTTSFPLHQRKEKIKLIFYLEKNFLFLPFTVCFDWAILGVARRFCFFGTLVPYSIRKKLVFLLLNMYVPFYQPFTFWFW